MCLNRESTCTIAQKIKGLQKKSGFFFASFCYPGLCDLLQVACYFLTAYLSQLIIAAKGRDT